MIDVRIKRNGVNVRLVGFGFRKYHNLQVLEAGLAAIKERVSRGQTSDDSTAPRLSKWYERFKLRKGLKPFRDLRLTGKLLDGELKPRYSDDRHAIADAGSRLGRIKARRYRDMLIFSPRDQAAMTKVAGRLFKQGVQQMVATGRRPGRAATSRRTEFNRRTQFGRAA